MPPPSNPSKLSLKWVSFSIGLLLLASVIHLLWIFQDSDPSLTKEALARGYTVFWSNWVLVQWAFLWTFSILFISGLAFCAYFLNKTKRSDVFNVLISITVSLALLMILGWSGFQRF